MEFIIFMVIFILIVKKIFGIGGIVGPIFISLGIFIIFSIALWIVSAIGKSLRENKKRKIITKITRYFAHCKPTDDYNFIKQKAFRKWGGIDFKLGDLDDKSDFYIEKELNAFVESVRVHILNDILAGYHEKGAVDDEFVTDMCRRYGRYCIGDITIRSFITSILIENGSKKTLDNGEIVFIAHNSTGGTNLKINDEMSEDDL